MSESGTLSSIVRVDGERPGHWVGGIHADLAPHGRGGGWGQVGAPDRRRLVRELLAEDSSSPELLAAAIKGLVRGPTHSVLAIDDLPSMTERHQELLLAAMGSARLGRGLLVWRPVLAVLHLTEDLEPSMNLGDGTVIGVLGQAKDGFSLQTLRLRRAKGRSGHIVAPERRKAGRALSSVFGYEGLVRLARKKIVGDERGGIAECLGAARSVGRLALGHSARPEMLRLPNSDWRKITPPRQLELPRIDLSAADLADFEFCDVVVLETLSVGPIRDHLSTGLEAVLGRQPVVLPSSAVARGGLVAAGRLAADDPVYFDFLPKISTIVQGAHGASNYDLIRDDETLPAGTLYRSPEPARFAIQPGQPEIVIHIRKEAESWPRKAVVDIGGRLNKVSPVDLWVEQSPASGRAKILMQAPDLSRQFLVDWEKAEIVEVYWDDIIESLSKQVPSIPARLVLPCGMQAWMDSHRRDGLLKLLDNGDDSERPDWKRLADQLTARPEGHYCISSDGDLPPGIPGQALERLEQLTEMAESQFLDRVKRGVEGDNQPLRFLTWQFRRCSEQVADALLEIVREGPPYPHFRQGMSPKLLFQGLGRIARTERMEEAVLRALLRRKVADWRWFRESACAAFLLSRSDTAPMFLSRRDVRHLAKVVNADFKNNLHTEYNKFYYAPFLLAGLLRWRLKDPHALVADRDQVATAFVDTVERTISDLNNRKNPSYRLSKKIDRYIPILEDILKKLQGEEGNPNLLLDIYGSGDDVE